jgi:Arc/MetJ family transcription regulator
MRTTITIDDELFEKASKVAGAANTSAVVRAALEAFVATESRKRLLMLSGKAPGFEIPERRRRSAPVSRVAEPKSEYPAGNPDSPSAAEP